MPERPAGIERRGRAGLPFQFRDGTRQPLRRGRQELRQALRPRRGHRTVAPPAFRVHLRGEHRHGSFQPPYGAGNPYEFRPMPFRRARNIRRQPRLRKRRGQQRHHQNHANRHAQPRHAGTVLSRALPHLPHAHSPTDTATTKAATTAARRRQAMTKGQRQPLAMAKSAHRSRTAPGARFQSSSR